MGSYYFYTYFHHFYTSFLYLLRYLTGKLGHTFASRVEDSRDELGAGMRRPPGGTTRHRIALYVQCDMRI